MEVEVLDVVDVVEVVVVVVLVDEEVMDVVGLVGGPGKHAQMLTAMVATSTTDMIVLNDFMIIPPLSLIVQQQKSLLGLAGSTDRADICTLGLIEETFAFSALCRIDHVVIIALGNSLVGAFAFAGTTTDTIISNLIRHLY